MKEDLSTEFSKAMVASDLSSLCLDYSEILLDRELDESLLKELPVIKTIWSGVKFGLSVHDHLFTKKLINFLTEIDQISADDRENYANKLESDPDFSEKVGDHYLLLLDRVDSLKKPALLGKAFRAYCMGKITAYELQKLGYAIDKLDITDLAHIREFSGNSTRMELEKLQGFQSAGFGCIRAGFDIAGSVEPTSLCKVFVEHVLPDEM